jgi:hypothetical protein
VATGSSTPYLCAAAAVCNPDKVHLVRVVAYSLELALITQGVAWVGPALGVLDCCIKCFQDRPEPVTLKGELTIAGNRGCNRLKLVVCRSQSRTEQTFCIPTSWSY